MGDMPPTVKLPEVLYDLLCEIGAVTQTQIDVAGKDLPSVLSGDTLKGSLTHFGQQIYTLGRKKESEAGHAVEVCDEESETRLYTQMDTMFGLLNLIISATLTPSEICDDRFVAKICRNYQIVLRMKSADDDDFETENEGDGDGDTAPKPPNRKKMH